MLALFTVKFYDIPKGSLKLDVYDLSGNFGVPEYKKMLNFLFKFNFSLYVAGLIAVWLVYKNSLDIPMYIEIPVYVLLFLFWWLRSSSLRHCSENIVSMKNQVRDAIKEEVAEVESRKESDWLNKARYLRELKPHTFFNKKSITIQFPS